MRGLPDQAGTKKDWIDQGQATQSADAELDDNSGSHVNLEIAFAYAVPRQTRQKVGTQVGFPLTVRSGADLVAHNLCALYR